MSTRTRPPELDFEVEEDVDLGPYWRSLALRWWLPVVGLLAGALIGYLISIGGEDVYRAQATVYLGQPLGGAGSNTPLATQQTNAAAVRQIVTSESVIRQVAADVGLRPGQLRGRVSTSAISGGRQQQQPPLATITVTGRTPLKVRRAANEFANAAAVELGGFARAKAANLREQIESYDRQLAALDRAAGGDPTAAAVLALRRGDLEDARLTATQLLAQAQQIESPRILTKAAATKTTARTRRSTIAVGAALGLLAGLAAALLWEPVAGRVGRRPRV